MPGGLAALLDDVSVIARAAASSVDDVAAATGRASSKTALLNPISQVYLPCDSWHLSATSSTDRRPPWAMLALQLYPPSPSEVIPRH